MLFLKTTVIGGVVFLLPIIVVGMILGKAFGFMSRIAAPFAEWIPIDSVGGIALVNLSGGARSTQNDGDQPLHLPPEADRRAGVAG